MTPNEFFRLSFDAALALTNDADVTVQQQRWERVGVWYRVGDDELLVEYEAHSNAPLSVQLCGTEAVLYRPH